MKKNLLMLGCLTLSYVVSAQVVTYIGDLGTYTDVSGATVKNQVTVTDGALVYSGGGWENGANSRVENTGDIMVVAGSTDNFTTATNAEFILKQNNLATYGQLFISGVPQANITGKITKEYLAQKNGAWQQAGIPFINYNLTDLAADLGFQLQGNSRSDKGAAFIWNNALARFDQVSGNFGNPTDYTILPVKDKNGVLQWDPTVDLKSFKGVPVSDQNAVVTNLPLTISTVSGSYGPLGNGTNAYHEWYKSYLDDPFAGPKTTAANWPAGGGTYGMNLSQFANPYLTNIDLSNITQSDKLTSDNDGIQIGNIKGISYYQTNDVQSWNPTVGTTYASGITAVLTSGGKFAAGDVSKLVIKPLGEVMIKFDTAQNPNINLNNTRTFLETGRASAVYSPTGKPGTGNLNAGETTKQVAVVLYDGNDTEISRTYYAVNSEFVTGNSVDSRQVYVEDLPIYTKEERLEGGEDPDYSYQMYINTANEVDFAHKQVPMYINSNQAVNMKFELYEDGVKIADNGDLSNGESFYIEKDGVVSKISAGMTMPANYGGYFLSYEEPEVTLGTNDALRNQTIIVKKEGNWVVRFAKDWKSGSIELYSMTGQLLKVARNVVTSQDYVIPVNSTGVYLVRVTSDKGQIVTKKILK